MKKIRYRVTIACDVRDNYKLKPESVSDYLNEILECPQEENVFEVGFNVAQVTEAQVIEEIYVPYFEVDYMGDYLDGEEDELEHKTWQNQMEQP